MISVVLVFLIVNLQCSRHSGELQHTHIMSQLQHHAFQAINKSYSMEIYEKETVYKNTATDKV